MFFQFMGKVYRKSDSARNRQSDVISHDNCHMETFGERLRRRRKKFGMRQSDLGRAANLSQTTISDIERGRNAGSTELSALARALRCRVEWLETGSLPEDDEGLSLKEWALIEKFRALPDDAAQDDAIRRVEEALKLFEFEQIQRQRLADVNNNVAAN